MANGNMAERLRHGEALLAEQEGSRASGPTIELLLRGAERVQRIQNIIARIGRKLNLEEPIKGARGRRLNCPLTEDIVALDATIIAGFGSATITRDGELFYDAPMHLEWQDATELEELEEIARQNPNHDWQHNLGLP